MPDKAFGQTPPGRGARSIDIADNLAPLHFIQAFEASPLDLKTDKTIKSESPLLRTVILTDGGTMLTALTSGGVAVDEAHALVDKLQPVYDLHTLKLGQAISLQFSADGQFNGMEMRRES